MSRRRTWRRGLRLSGLVAVCVVVALVTVALADVVAFLAAGVAGTPPASTC